jgi:hypothetical protein
MSGIPSASDKYAVHDQQAMREWWRAVLVTARATVTMKKGSRIFVTERIEDLAKTPREQKFIKLHVVSVATGSMYEWERFVNTPARAVGRAAPAPSARCPSSTASTPRLPPAAAARCSSSSP